MVYVAHPIVYKISYLIENYIAMEENKERRVLRVEVDDEVKKVSITGLALFMALSSEFM